jgi:ketosteroid isomerase-like protein
MDKISGSTLSRRSTRADRHRLPAAWSGEHTARLDRGMEGAMESADRMIRAPIAMKLLIPVLLLAIAIAIPTAEGASGRDRDLAALRAVHSAWIAAYTSSDIAALERFYSDDSVIMPDGRPAYRGWPEIRDFFAPGFERFNYAARADLQYLDVSGDLGTARGVVTLTVTPKAGGPPSTRQMRYLIVFKRQRRGDWCILLDMDNRAVD